MRGCAVAMMYDNIFNGDNWIVSFQTKFETKLGDDDLNIIRDWIGENIKPMSNGYIPRMTTTYNQTLVWVNGKENALMMFLAFR